MNLQEAYEAEGIAPPKGRAGHPEHSLQSRLKVLCREYVATPHMFAAHDRSENVGGMQHYWEKMRGAIRGWPDIQLPLLGGLTFRCELKAAGKIVADNSDQARIIRDLNNLGHPTAWANSAIMFVRVAKQAGVPFRVGVERRAQAIDDMLAEEARQRTLATPKKKRASRPRKEPTNRAGLNAVARARAAGTFI